MGFGEPDRIEWIKGQNPELDARLTAARPDIAWAGLKGKIKSAQFTAGSVRTIVVPFADLKKTPRASAPLLTQALYGEKFRSLKEQGSWAFGQLLEDGYVGYLKCDALGSHAPEATHVVAIPLTHVYAKPDLKTPGPEALPLGARVAIRAGELRVGFAEAQGLGWIYARHIVSINKPEKDYLKTAARFLHAPYLWGGKTSRGLDCSALIQLALVRAGVPCPRDTDQQAKALGHSISNAPDLSLCKKGDLVFFPGHAGFMADETRLLHANASHMRVTLEDVKTVAQRLEQTSQAPVLDIRRLS